MARPHKVLADRASRLRSLETIRLSGRKCVQWGIARTAILLMPYVRQVFASRFCVRRPYASPAGGVRKASRNAASSLSEPSAKSSGICAAARTCISRLSISYVPSSLSRGNTAFRVIVYAICRASRPSRPSRAADARSTSKLFASRRSGATAHRYVLRRRPCSSGAESAEGQLHQSSLCCGSHATREASATRAPAVLAMTGTTTPSPTSISMAVSTAALKPSTFITKSPLGGQAIVPSGASSSPKGTRSSGTGGPTSGSLKISECYCFGFALNLPVASSNPTSSAPTRQLTA